MQVSFFTRSTVLALVLAGVACAGNNSSDTEMGAAQDTSAERSTESTNVNQTEFGVTDSSDTEMGAAQDTSAERSTESTNANQTESGMTDSSGQSTLGAGAETTRPDQGQPVTSKGDTVNPSIDSSTTPR